jgi:excinuclease UvrABC nuclease subunit
MQITDIKGIGAKTAKSLYETGYKTIEELKKASTTDILSVKGIGKSTITKIEEHKM